MSVYNLAIFTSSFLYPSVGVGAIVTDIVVVGVVACGGGNSKLRGEVGWDIGKVVVGVLLGIS